MRILCYGDSNTYGYDPRSYFGGRYPAESRWVDILAGKTGWEVINAGENGRVIPKRAGEIQRFQELLLKARPDHLIVMLGGNDLLQGAAPADAAARMEALLTALTDLEPGNILLIGPPPKQLGSWVPTKALVLASIELSRQYQRLAEKIGVHFADAGAWDIELTFDGVHYTETGHAAFAEGIYRAIKQAWPSP